MNQPSTSLHRIRRRTLELHVGDPVDAAKWRQQARGLWDEALAPALENTLEDFSPADGRTWRIPRLEVELHLDADTPWTEVENSFATLLREQLTALQGAAKVRNASQGINGGAPETEITSGRRTREWITYWLRHGTLPWWVGSPNAQTTAEALLEILLHESRGNPARWLSTLIKAHPAAARRLGSHLPRELQPQLLNAATSGKNASSGTAQQIAGWLRTWSNQQDVRKSERLIWEATWLAWAQYDEIPHTWPTTVERVASAVGASSPATLLKLLQSSIADDMTRPSSQTHSATIPSTSPAPASIAENESFARNQSPRAKSEPTDAADPAAPDALEGEDAVFTVNNAGLVLLAPYFPGFFAALGYDRVLARPGSDDGQSKTFAPEAGRLVGLLHYLATGATEAFEPELLLPKLLCGLPPEWPAPASFEPTELEKSEIANLLASVIGHWSALGQTTADGLRASFLNRPGALTLIDEAWQLRVENRGWDVLVDRIPWTFRMVKLSWMPKPIWVEWNRSP